MPAGQVQLIVCDVDGVLTDGGIVIDAHGIESKRFHVLDGMAVALLRRAGIEVAFLSGRSSPVVAARARELGVRLFWSGVENKRSHLEAELSKSGGPDSPLERPISSAETCFVGDDVNDLACLELVGYPVAVRNARPEVKARAEHVTETPGGSGALREVAEIVLKARGQWAAVLEGYR